MDKKIDKSLQYRYYLSPKYWPMWFMIGLLRLSVFLPTVVTQWLGSALGTLIYYVAPSRKRVSRINIKQAFPNFTETEINTLNKKAFQSLGTSVFEMGAAWFEKSSVLKKHCLIEGKENLDDAISKNKPIILLTGHFTTLEIGGRLISFYCNKTSGVYKKARNPLFNAIMVNNRSIILDDIIENKNVRGIIRGLKEGYATWFAPDQDFKRQDIVFTPFLGGIATTLTATAKLARITDASVVPFYPVRLEKGKGFKLVVLPALDNFPTDDIKADSARVNKTIEDMVYNLPEQYIWSHKRFKTQENGRSLYEQ